MNPTRGAMLWMVAFVALWVLVEVISTWFHLAYSPFEVVWGRYAAHLAIMVAIFGWRDPLALVRTRRPLLQIGRSMLMLVMPAAWVLAMERGLDVDTVLSLFGVSPLLICVLAVLLLNERATRGIWISAIVVSVGALFCLSLQGLAANRRGGRRHSRRNSGPRWQADPRICAIRLPRNHRR